MTCPGKQHSPSDGGSHDRKHPHEATHDDPGGKRTSEQLGTGHSHGFQPMQSLDIRRATSAAALLEEMSRTAFSGRSLGEALDVFVAMAEDKECLKVLTLSGAMTMAKMGLLVCELIENKLVDVVISTGALMCHGLVEAAGMTHFKYEEGWDDKELFEAGYCRVYDTLELEKNLDDTSHLIDEVLAKLDPADTLCSFKICKAVGKHLAHTTQGRGIAISAYKHNVPIYIPAFTDSELGLDVALFNRTAREEGRPVLNYNPFIDLDDYTERVRASKRVGIMTIGGGVPRNWAQQVGPYLDLQVRRKSGVNDNPVRFQYGVRICPEPVHWGGLSGCTYSEGVSWGKFVPRDEGGRYAEVYADATVAWPLLVRGAMERLGLL